MVEVAPCGPARVHSDGTRVELGDGATRDTVWEQTAENALSTVTDLSRRPVAQRLALMPSLQIMYNRAPDRVAPGLAEAQAEAARRPRSRSARLRERAEKRRREHRSRGK